MNFLPVTYHTLVNNIPDSILILDMQNRLIELNPSAENLLGSPKSSLKGQLVQQLWPDLSSLLPQSADGKSADLSFYSHLNCILQASIIT